MLSEHLGYMERVILPLTGYLSVFTRDILSLHSLDKCILGELILLKINEV